MRLTLLVFFAASAATVQAADLSVRVEGAPVGATLVLQVYNSPNAFGDFRNPVIELRVSANADPVYSIPDVPAGEIAVLVYLDENGNGLIDKNFIGIPKETLGISNGYRPKGPPVFERAKITVADDAPTTIDINLYKVLGERGRLGVGLGVIGRSSPYLGSDTTVLQPIPAITYNGERLQWLGPNLNYGLVGAGPWRLAATASYRIGVYEENDSTALIGLGDRDGTLMAGLGLRLELPGGTNLSLRYEHDVLDKIGGGAATARVSKGFQAGAIRLVPEFQVNWLSTDLTNYDFGVPQNAATALRPAYNTGSSLSVEAGFSSFIEITEEWRILFNLSAEFLPGEISNSPIVDDDQVIKGFAAITYVF